MDEPQLENRPGPDALATDCSIATRRRNSGARRRRRLDHFTADAKRRRLFASALGNNTVEVIDVFAGRVVHSIKGLGRPLISI
jgi:hypothetical protein